MTNLALPLNLHLLISFSGIDPKHAYAAYAAGQKWNRSSPPVL